MWDGSWEAAGCQELLGQDELQKATLVSLQAELGSHRHFIRGMLTESSGAGRGGEPR